MHATRLLLTAALLCLAPIAEARGLKLGYNQAWIEGSYGHDLTDRFDADAWERIMQRTREGGGSAVRVWILEGRDKEGVIWQGHRPAGVQPVLLTNLRPWSAWPSGTTFRSTGRWSAPTGPSTGPRGRSRPSANTTCSTTKHGHGALFRARVVRPILEVLNEKPRVNFAFDIMNEVQGSVRAHFWSDGWTGARKFLRAMTAFIHANAPGLKVTASSGHHTAAWDILVGRYDGVGLDFYDIHVYDDDGEIPFARFLAWHARSQGLPIIVGEFGQKDDADDPALQAEVTRNVLREARRFGFKAAFAWRLEDEQKNGRRFSFYDDDRPRPALNVMRAAAGLPAIDLTPAARCRGAAGAVRQSQ